MGIHMPESHFFELVGDESEDVFPIRLRGIAAIAVVPAELLQVVVQVAQGELLSTGHHSRCVRWLCCSPAPHGAYSARDGVPVGTAQARESLTQDSRSAVKARLVDPLRESFGEERCTPGTADESFTQDPTERR